VRERRDLSNETRISDWIRGDRGATILLDIAGRWTVILRTGSKEMFDLPSSAMRTFAYLSFTWWALEARRYVIV
jgi:hypothetical protein